jgi:hypothetical protein
VNKQQKKALEKVIGEAAAYAGLTAFINQTWETIKKYERRRTETIHGKLWRDEYDRRVINESSNAKLG